MKINDENIETNEEWVNKITLECMMNKKHYKTYLEKTNPEKLKESYNLQTKIVNNSFLIESIFDTLLENSKNNLKGEINTHYNNDIEYSFNNFIQHVLIYIEETEQNVECEIDDEKEENENTCVKKIYPECESIDFLIKKSNTI